MSRNVAKLLARLNPRSMRLEASAGRGTSVPDLTSIDIAGALGAAAGGDARMRLAIDVLCLRWWPARVEGPMRTVGHRLVHHDPDWHKKLGIPMTQFTSACCERVPVEAPSETPAFTAIADLIGRRLYLKTDGLPSRVRETDFIQRWARAIIAEYRKPNHCPTCSPGPQPGELAIPRYKGSTLVNIEWVVCPECDGSAVAAWSKRRRARSAQIREGTFRHSGMSEIHDGALALLRELEHRGARALVRSVGR